MSNDNQGLLGRGLCKKYLIYMCYQHISNQVTDETFNQIQQKLQQAEMQKNEAFTLAEIELKKETIYDKARAVKRSYNQFNKYRLR